MNSKSGVLAVVGALCMAACASWSRGGDPEQADAGASSDASTTADGAADGAAVTPPDGGGAPATTFATIHPLLLSACRDCHRAGGQAANTTLLYNGNASADLAATLPYINRNDAGNSRLLTKAAGRNHGGGSVWAQGSSQAAAVIQWIQQGTQP